MPECLIVKFLQDFKIKPKIYSRKYQTHRYILARIMTARVSM
jgi:hypothetical protein